MRESRQQLNDDVLWLIVIFCTTDNGITKMPLQKMNSEVRPEDGKRRHVICVDRQNIPILCGNERDCGYLWPLYVLRLPRFEMSRNEVSSTKLKAMVAIERLISESRVMTSSMGCYSLSNLRPRKKRRLLKHTFRSLFFLKVNTPGLYSQGYVNKRNGNVKRYTFHIYKYSMC